jgi:acrylyl-CoA reductase (NADPH)
MQAIQVDKDSDGNVASSLIDIDPASLPEGDVTVAVDYSTINYKDGLVLNGLGGLVRNYPHIPGIDFSGTVTESQNDAFKINDKVVLTGWRVGETHWGGYSELARVKADWLVPLPDGLSTRQAMAIGTAGMAAMLGIVALEEAGMNKDDGPVLVTGAAGGVGSIACAVLAACGYEVDAVTGRESSGPHLRSLGVSSVIPRADIETPNGKPLNKERWIGCVDSVGGAMLANILTQMKYGGSVAAIGLAGGAALETTVIPFLLRGVNLLGIDSVMCPNDKRMAAWQRLATDLPTEALEAMINEVPLADVPALGSAILSGQVQGRTVVKIS